MLPWKIYNVNNFSTNNYKRMRVKFSWSSLYHIFMPTSFFQKLCCNFIKWKHQDLRSTLVWIEKTQQITFFFSLSRNISCLEENKKKKKTVKTKPPSVFNSTSPIVYPSQLSKMSTNDLELPLHWIVLPSK